MLKKLDKNKERLKRHDRIRKKISGTSEKPRLCVYRSLKHIYVQIVDDSTGNTLVAASTLDKELKGNSGGDLKAAEAVGKLAAQKAVEKGIVDVVFDRGGYLYHGRIKALADAARSAGLNF